VLVVHQPAASKPVGDFFDYVGATASAAGQVRLDAAARDLNAVSGCDVRLLVETTLSMQAGKARSHGHWARNGPKGCQLV